MLDQERAGERGLERGGWREGAGERGLERGGVRQSLVSYSLT
jgi:hypothetical protein